MNGDCFDRASFMDTGFPTFICIACLNINISGVATFWFAGFKHLVALPLCHVMSLPKRTYIRSILLWFDKLCTLPSGSLSHTHRLCETKYMDMKHRQSHFKRMLQTNILSTNIINNNNNNKNNNTKTILTSSIPGIIQTLDLFNVIITVLFNEEKWFSIYYPLRAK